MGEQQGKVNIFEGTMAHMTYVQIEEAAKKKLSILFPAGVIEEHGPHLPLGVDVYGAYLQSRAIQSELEKRGVHTLIAPPFYWGINKATGAFAGSFSSREETVISVLGDAMSCLKRWGFDCLFFINHHLDGSHMQAVDRAIHAARKEVGIRAYWIMDPFVAKRLGYKGDEEHLLLHKSLIPAGPPPEFLDIHAEGYETSLIWDFLPELINLDIWRGLKPTNLTFKDLEVWRKGGMDAREVTPNGYFGDPTTARPERGKKEVEAYGRIAARVIEDFLKGRYSPPKESPSP